MTAPVLGSGRARLAIGVALVLVVGAAVVALAVAAPHPPRRTDTAPQAAAAFVEAANDQNYDELYRLWCSSEVGVPDHSPGDFGNTDGVDLGAISEPAGGPATFVVTVHRGGVGDPSRLALRQRNGAWCVGW